ncbi:MAG: tRNA dihydrouridine synthase DusB [Eubacterium sp.]|nr:tRNA dihydrouridine synthase DusB [Eubacterium sp.]
MKKTEMFRNKLFLGPMAGVTDLPFRTLCKEQGCDVFYTEMVSAKAIYYKNKNTIPLLTLGENEHPIGVQLFGSEPDIMADMGAQVAEGDCDFIDVNLGCPVPKIVNNHEGSYLMTQPKLVEEILTAMRKKIDKPITVKIRKGFNPGDNNAVEIAKIAEGTGMDAIVVHPRTRDQFFSGESDWSVIKEVKDAVSIPVIGNGDIKTPQDAKAMYDETGCDSIMIARAAQGNPWIFREVKHYLEIGELLAKPTREEVRHMIIRHAKMLVEFKGEYTGVREMRKHVSWYTAGIPYSSKIRRRVNSITDLDGLIKLTLECL